MPSPASERQVDSPWGELSFTAVRNPRPRNVEVCTPENVPGLDNSNTATNAAAGRNDAPPASSVSPARTSSGRKRASRAAQFMPFAALTGYYELIREQEILAQQRVENNREQWKELP